MTDTEAKYSWLLRTMDQQDKRSKERRDKRRPLAVV
jgi:hypothetical protein